MKGLTAKKPGLWALLIICAAVVFLFVSRATKSRESTLKTSHISGAKGYSGSSSCRKCHRRFYDLWSNSHHGLAMQPYTAAFSQKNLTPQADPIRVGKDRASYKAEIGPGEGWIKETISGKIRTYPILHVMGGKNVYYFLTPVARGRLQTLPLAYNVKTEQWYDAMASGVRHFPGTLTDEPVQWTDPMYTFNTSCYHCHVSQLSTNYDLTTDTYHSQWSEPGINCEACHGPGLEHVEVCESAAKENPPQDLKIISMKTFSTDQTNAMCNSCHAKLIPITASFEPGNHYFDHYDLVMLESPDFYPDGRDLGENYTMTLWRLSSCAKSGRLDCIHCHTSSGRYRFQGRGNMNGACLPCHSEQVADITKHSRHRRMGKAPQCISCHMPMTQFANMNRTDHSMRPPVPEATLKYKSPNACNLCHAEKTAEWAQKYVSKWGKDTRQKQYLQLADFVDQARKKDWKNLEQMLAYIQQRERDEIITGSLIRLLRACDSHKKWPVLIKVLENDPSPLVRATAAEGLKGHLTRQTLQALLKAVRDDYRLVRIRAAASMASVNPRQLLLKNLRRNFERAMKEFIESMTARPDHFVSHYNLGNIYLDQGKIEQALDSYQTSLALRPGFIPCRVNIAFAYHAKGQKEKAEQSFREALKWEPDNVLVQTNLALLLGEMRRLDEAEAIFRRVLKTDPESAVAAFNLAVILAKTKPQESLLLSEKAFSLRPDNPRYAYTYAYYLTTSGKTREAIGILHKMVDGQTPNADAYVMLGQIYEQRGEPQKAVDIYMKAAGNMKLPEMQRKSFYSRAEEIKNIKSKRAGRRIP